MATPTVAAISGNISGITHRSNSIRKTFPDPRLGTYFDIGLSGGPASTIPQGSAFLYQFGVASKTPVSGWSVSMFYPSFQYHGSWLAMESANIVQGDFSYWKVNYRWGGRPYPGVTAAE